MLSRRGPISPSRATNTPANRAAPDVFPSDVLANLHLHLKHTVDLARITEMRDA
jgi:hypothetical protein